MTAHSQMTTDIVTTTFDYSAVSTECIRPRLRPPPMPDAVRRKLFGPVEFASGLPTPFLSRRYERLR